MPPFLFPNREKLYHADLFGFKRRPGGAFFEKSLAACTPQKTFGPVIGLLQSGELGSAGLDVFEHEPAVPEALKAIPHVVLTPHLGGGTLPALEAMQNLVAANIAAFFAGGSVLTPVPEMMG